MSPSTVRQTARLESDWKFHLGDIPAPIPNKHISAYMASKAGWAGGAARPDFDDSDWRSLTIPHDWSIEGPFDPANHVDNGFLPQGIAWYRRHFSLNESDRGKYLALQFDGVAKYCTVAVNGHILHRHFCGYTPFTVDISDVASFGDELNVVALRVDATPMEGWWYEGAGIYRNVWLIKASPLHIATGGIFVCPKKVSPHQWDTQIETTLTNASDAQTDCRVRWIIERENGQVVDEADAIATLSPRESRVIPGSIEINSPVLWSLENPTLYRLKTQVTIDGATTDDTTTTFGFRTIRFDPQEGFFLNGKPVKLKGTCNHADHAGVGVAVPDSIQEFRIRRLKEMGANAYRCAHNPPAPALLDACDRLGMLVMDENRHFGTSPEHLRQLRAMVLRDRNHPSIILWSICNEEAIQGTAAAANIAKGMQRAVKELDTSRPVTAAVSGGILNETGIGTVIEVMGINYQLPLHDQYHAKHPAVPLVAAETHCVLATRGSYTTDDSTHTFAATGADLASWGTAPIQTWRHVESRPFIAGFFAWTGFDYRGEPTPHAWPCVNSHFGIMDTCGFPKDAFFLHKALLDPAHFLHLLPHWNWPGREGSTIRVEAYTNCKSVELFLNGKSLGRQNVDEAQMPTWDVPYHPGQLKGVAFNSEGSEPAAQAITETTGEPKKLNLQIHPSFDARSIPADGRFSIPVTVSAVDSANRPVPTAHDLIKFSVAGPAIILGVGNGNPTSHEPDKASERSLFHGLAQVILQTTPVPGEIKLTASAQGVAPAVLSIHSTETQTRSVPPAKVRYLLRNWQMSPITPTRPDASATVMEQDMNSWDRIDPRTGPQLAWSRTSGYAIYRATGKVPKILQQTGGRIVFPEIIGQAEAFLDGANVAKKSDASAAEFSIAFPAGLEQLTVTLILHAQRSPAGITRPVEFLPKT